MKKLIALMTLTVSGFASAQGFFPAACDGNELLSNYQTIIYRFSFESECKKALAEAKASKGFFCDNDKIVWPSGHVFHDFNWGSQCQEALVQFQSSDAGLFCDGTAMYQIRFGYLLHHSFESGCKEALAQARDHKGLFCRDGQMFDSWGTQLRDYRFNSSCKEALKKITF